MRIELSYESKEIEELYKEIIKKHNPENTGFDLIASETENTELTFNLLSTGIIARPPEGYYFEVVPRSSTFKNYGVILANSIGIIDKNYCGKSDIIKLPLLRLNSSKDRIVKGTRIAQLILRKYEPISEIQNFDPSEKSRGGFGSTGI